MSLETTIGIAKIGTKSLRATIPEGVVAYLNLQSGDKLEWRMEIEDGQKVVKVRKATKR
jgi:bifunctional DNA-binding transcriptional regulator/antitoxin component of YhaV-PrlF toxin-antitoxin module